MANGNRAAFGIYPDTSTVNDAVEALKASGFRQTDISILYADNVGSKDFGHQRNSKAPEGSVVGGAIGVLVGAACGWLVGSGTMPVPGLEFLATSGPILSTIAAAGVGTLARRMRWGRASADRCQSTKLNVMKAVFGKAAFCCPFIAIILVIGKNPLRKR